ncbi:hypothetical protein [Legionella norrlandica]|uniref:hypothetical protein n=1 Tax=Legionella norrlandica TaxID=1498499 RepID=UPI000AFCF5D1|nr:hypothetical protein [Legionella norrlandica]
MLFFYHNKQEALPFFKKATDILPENPYYKLRYLELAGDERRHEARKRLKK